MENIQLLRYVASLEERLKDLEKSLKNGFLPSSLENSVIPTDLTDVLSRLAAVEARPVVDLTDVSGRLAAVEARPELSQSLSALELTVTRPVNISVSFNVTLFTFKIPSTFKFLLKYPSAKTVPSG